MRLDVITIFPEYLDPLRHALLGKAIEQGRLEVGVHGSGRRMHISQSMTRRSVVAPAWL